MERILEDASVFVYDHTPEVQGKACPRGSYQEGRPNFRPAKRGGGTGLGGGLDSRKYGSYSREVDNILPSAIPKIQRKTTQEPYVGMFNINCKIGEKGKEIKYKRRE